MAHLRHWGLRKRLAAGFVVAAIAVGANSQAWAGQVTGPGVVTLPDAVVSGFAFASASGSVEYPDGTGAVTNETQNTPLTGPGQTPIGVSAKISCQCSVPDGNWIYSTSSVTGSVNVSVLPNPGISAHATIVAPAAYGAVGNVQVSAEINYYFEIVDNGNPQAQSPVPITVSAAGGFTYSNTFPSYEENAAAAASSSFGVSGIFNDRVTGDASVDPGGTLVPKSWADNQTYMMDSGEQYMVTLIVGFNGSVPGNEGGGGATFSAYVDPTFAVGPGADPSRYSLVFSEGVGNSAVGAVPEPSAWAMLLVGFAGIGLAGYRRISSDSIPLLNSSAASRK